MPARDILSLNQARRAGPANHFPRRAGAIR
jgi:hypothetical protein